MLHSSQLRQLADRCNRIASEISDADDFISIRRLVEKFRARLHVRPLLVEAMLATSQVVQGDNKAPEWCLLLDCETHAVTNDEIAAEKYGSPLPPRLRNTVAHELAHSLAFRMSEYGIRLEKRSVPTKPKQEFVKSIERETEKISPLLLLSYTALDKIFSAGKPRCELKEICKWIRSAGASRYVFVNRLTLLEMFDPKGLLNRPALSNTAIGIGKWVTSKKAQFMDWPLFSNFEGGKVPSFIFDLQKRVPVAAENIFANTAFYLFGGDCETSLADVDAGTPRHPKMANVRIRCSIEIVPRKAGAEFLFIVQTLKPSVKAIWSNV
jgi:hypothetical protein